MLFRLLLLLYTRFSRSCGNVNEGKCIGLRAWCHCALWNDVIRFSLLALSHVLLMVNVGRPSRGCWRCRRLKVKCDEEQPTCGRCQRTGRECPGYVRDPRFRSMNQSSEAKVKSRIRQRLGNEDEGSSSSSRTDTPPNIAQPRQTRGTVGSEITRSLRTDWNSQSIELYFSEWVEGPDPLHSFWGAWEKLPDIYQHSPCVYMKEAVKAAALANMRNASAIEHFDRMARRSYGKALLGLGEAMKSDETALTLDALTAVNALAIYEVRRS